MLVATAMLLVAACAGHRGYESSPAQRPAAGLPASGQAGRPAEHMVRSGETLYGIARRYAVTPADLARWNNLGADAIIRPGQRLKLAAGQGTAPAPEVRRAPPFRWPAAGPLLAGFGGDPAALSGLLIGGRVGDGVRAAASGTVVYAGNGLPGYGELLIIKHDETWLTAYGHNSVLLVGEGTRIAAGDTIARVGMGPGRRPVLHFEVRRNGAPVDPMPLLPRR